MQTEAQIKEALIQQYAALYRTTDGDPFDSGFMSGLYAASRAFGFEMDEIRDMREEGKRRGRQTGRVTA